MEGSGKGGMSGKVEWVGKTEKVGGENVEGGGERESYQKISKRTSNYYTTYKSTKLTCGNTYI